ncbi:Hypothetical predicted protein [Olea europaea subsp. europaea]|uniref:Uncharacterized protein n=1 Tax=Olea europaea subsp. europaea TaxID=158383 RepID=A0A8S0U1C2_OLEEU|nr:Hypothetical predicted protein [Olea europaea subsp. europaea]
MSDTFRSSASILDCSALDLRADFVAVVEVCFGVHHIDRPSSVDKRRGVACAEFSVASLAKLISIGDAIASSLQSRFRRPTVRGDMFDSWIEHTVKHHFTSSYKHKR